MKALQRRAKACEVLKDLEQALEDLTAVCIIESFQNQATLVNVDRVLKELGKLLKYVLVYSNLYDLLKKLLTSISILVA